MVADTDKTLIKADLHVHTEYSMDSRMRLDTIIRRCIKKGINCVAISDHGNIRGALKMREIAPFTVIVAQEILTSSGEVMGMFVEQEVPNGLTLVETMKRIRAQGGLVCVPHPFDRFRGLALKTANLEELVPFIDIVEVFNARSVFDHDSQVASEFAARHGLPRSAGTDAHLPFEIGSTYVKMQRFEGRNDFLQSLAQAEIVARKLTYLSYFPRVLGKLRQILR